MTFLLAGHSCVSVCLCVLSFLYFIFLVLAGFLPLVLLFDIPTMPAVI